VPELPGVLRESLAAGPGRDRTAARPGRRVGPRADHGDGVPAALVGNAETRRRVQAWIDANGWRSDYAAVSGLLAPATTVPADLAAPLQSLFTRTVGRASAWTTIHLRPPLPPR